MGFDSTEVVETQETENTLETQDSEGTLQADDIEVEEQPEQKEEDSEGSEQTEGEEGAEGAQAAAYKPNFKFTTYGKEQEIPEIFRGIITDEQSEKAVRELHEKAHALEIMKPRYQEVRQELEQMRTEVTPVFQDLQRIGQSIQKGDIEPLLEAFNVPYEKLLKYVADKVRYNEMSPEERRRVDQQRELQQEATQSQNTLSQMQTANLQLATQLRTMELNLALEKQEVKSVVQAVDAKFGNGAFRRRIIEIGKTAALESGGKVDLPVDHIIHQLVQEYGWMAQAPASAQATQAKAASQARKRPAVIPAVAGRSTAPGRKVVSSIADLKKLAAEMNETD